MHGSTGAFGIERGAHALTGTAGVVGAVVLLAGLRLTTLRRSSMAAIPSRSATWKHSVGSAIFPCPVPPSGRSGRTT